MRAADVALYTSKEEGRNRATAADPVVIDVTEVGDPTLVTPA
jgi:hypothetical protein